MLELPIGHKHFGNVDIRFLNGGVCARWSFPPRIECPLSAAKVEQKHVLRIPEGNPHEAQARPVSPTHSAPTGIRLLAKLGTWGSASAWIECIA